MNAAWKMGYQDAKEHRERAYEDGPVAVIGIVAYDYSQGYRAGNRDSIWANGNRPPEHESQGNSEEAAFRKAMSTPAEVWYPCGCKASTGAPKYCPEHGKNTR